MKVQVARGLVFLLTLTILPELPLSKAFCRVLSTTDGQVLLECAPRHHMKVGNQVHLDTIPALQAGSWTRRESKNINGEGT